MKPLLTLACILLTAGAVLCGQEAKPTPAQELVSAAKKQIGVTVSYDPAYVSLKFPLGDVPEDRGVCTDVVIRALRKAWQLDLQEKVNGDMKSHFGSYPKRWGLARPDKNIDHRRVPNLQTYFTRQGWNLPLPKGKTPPNSPNPADFRAGDLVTCVVPPNLPHIMLVSDKTSPSGVPLVIHNIGRGTQEEDRLLSFELTGHYRPKLAR